MNSEFYTKATNLHNYITNNTKNKENNLKLNYNKTATTTK